MARLWHALSARAVLPGLTGGAVQGWHNMYEMLWACNVAMVLAGYGIITDRPSKTLLSRSFASTTRAPAVLPRSDA